METRYMARKLKILDFATFVLTCDDIDDIEVNTKCFSFTTFQNYRNPFYAAGCGQRFGRYEGEG